MEDLSKNPANPNLGVYAQAIYTYRQDIFAYMKDMWKKEPQPVKPEYQDRWNEVVRSQGETWERLRHEVTAEWFGDRIEIDDGIWTYEWYDFNKHNHITWQQCLVLLAVNKSKDKRIQSMISIVSGHGIGKSTVLAWIILWFLYCFYQCQTAVTAPTSTQMNDVLWKELAKWIGKLPFEVREIYDWKSDYVRMKYSPETWFARARTSTKENTEAIAGVHADNVLIAIDEASGVPEQVYNTAEGALTSGDILLVMISNGTRTVGYFYDSHNKNQDLFQTFAFNGMDSPMVDMDYVKLIARRHGAESDEFRIRVSGGFSKVGEMDMSGYIQLFEQSEIKILPRVDVQSHWYSDTVLGIDPAGEGKDKATFVARDAFKIEKLDELDTSNERMLAERAITWATRLKIDPKNVVIDGFGVGTRLGQIIVQATKGNILPYVAIVGNSPAREEELQPQYFMRKLDELVQNRANNNEAWTQDKPEDMFLNIRALMYFRLHKFLKAGGYIVDNDTEQSEFRNELVTVRYKRALQGNKIQLMTKKEAKKLGFKSPNIADAGALTMLRYDTIERAEYSHSGNDSNEEEYDPYDIV